MKENEKDFFHINIIGDNSTGRCLFTGRFGPAFLDKHYINIIGLYSGFNSCNLDYYKKIKPRR